MKVELSTFLIRQQADSTRHRNPFTKSRITLWSSGQSSWLQILRSEFDSRRYQMFWEAVGLERDPSLVSTNEELLRRKNSSSGLENRDYNRRDPSRRPRDTPLTIKVGTNFAESGGRSVGIDRSRAETTGYYTVLVSKSCWSDHINFEYNNFVGLTPKRLRRESNFVRFILLLSSSSDYLLFYTVWRCNITFTSSYAWRPSKVK
jgi:hypothetical protein